GRRRPGRSPLRLGPDVRLVEPRRRELDGPSPADRVGDDAGVDALVAAAASAGPGPGRLPVRLRSDDEDPVRLAAGSARPRGDDRARMVRLFARAPPGRA